MNDEIFDLSVITGGASGLTEAASKGVAIVDCRRRVRPAETPALA
ncbi:MAG TPA: hypothetical protein VEL06_12260 [Haliangiales bacterium]|nr:hypothetical protein [Haliangiales bacterium]